ncbi:MAG: NCS2 family permease, partial [Campylobacterota bacterium]|nr:NCS2 family permease [Campylobacterota bacterium]
NTTVATELRAGFTTFLAMVYIVPVNAFIMSQAGMPMDALITATALITFLATLLSGLWSNTPVAMSVGMGINAYFTFGLVLGMGLTWQSALGVVFVSGIIFLILSLTPFRAWIIESIPYDLKRAISAGIGTFIAFIAFKEMGFIVSSEATLVQLGDLSNSNVLLGILGLLIVVAFWSLRIRGAFLLAILITAIVGWSMGLAPKPSAIIASPAPITPIFLELDIASVLTLSMVPVIITFLVTDMFDSLGTLSGVGYRAKLFEKDSHSLQRTLEADAGATVLGAMMGVSTTTSYIESAAGVEEGGRTGLTAVVTALLFLSTLFFLPLFKSIPANAIYPVLVVVGVLMFSELKKINFDDPAIAIASFLIILMMPLTFSITQGLAFGFISYFIVKVILRQWHDITIGTGLLAGISILAFVV